MRLRNLQNDKNIQRKSFALTTIDNSGNGVYYLRTANATLPQRKIRLCGFSFAVLRNIYPYLRRLFRVQPFFRGAIGSPYGARYRFARSEENVCHPQNPFASTACRTLQLLVLIL